MNPTVEDLVMAHRYLYYVRGAPKIPDRDYDVLESCARMVLPETSPVHKPGSDLKTSYSRWQVHLADKLEEAR